MKPTRFVTSFSMGLLVALGACGDGSTSSEEFACEGDPGQQFTVTFTGDASFQESHAGQVATDRIICVGGNPDSYGQGSGPISFPPETISFGSGSTVESGESYEIHLWIDSNVGGGTVGVCDPPPIDHQWKVLIPPVTGDVDIIFSHDDATVIDVCSTFAP